MSYDPNIHRRRSIRLDDYDYRQAGFYFVTICIQNRECLLGEIHESVMQLSPAGTMIAHWYRELEHKFPHLKTDAFICMPNHIHMILNVGANLCVCPNPVGLESGQTRRFAPTGLSEIVQWYKTMTTNHYISGVKQLGWQPFRGRLWQRNYWEHIVRDERSLNAIRDYIVNNPKTWELDQLNRSTIIDQRVEPAP